MYLLTRLSGNIRFMRMLAVVLEIYVNFPYIYVCLRPSIQVWYAVLVVKITLRLLTTAANRLSYF